MVTNIPSASIETTICATCAQNGPTCCQLEQGQTDFSFPLSGVEKDTISACDRWQGMCFTARLSNSTRFISHFKNLFPNDRDRIQAFYPEHGRHEHLLTDERGRCVSLGPAGCLLPGKACPLYCRLFTNSFIIGCFLAFLRRRLVTAVHLNIGVMRAATFFPVIPHFLADKGIWIFAPNVAAGADLAPSRQHFFHFHLRLLSSRALACRIKKAKKVYFLPATVPYAYPK